MPQIKLLCNSLYVYLEVNDSVLLVTPFYLTDPKLNFINLIQLHLLFSVIFSGGKRKDASGHIYIGKRLKRPLAISPPPPNLRN